MRVSLFFDDFSYVQLGNEITLMERNHPWNMFVYVHVYLDEEMYCYAPCFLRDIHHFVIRILIKLQEVAKTCSCEAHF